MNGPSESPWSSPATTGKPSSSPAAIRTTAAYAISVPNTAAFGTAAWPFFGESSNRLGPRAAANPGEFEQLKRKFESGGFAVPPGTQPALTDSQQPPHDLTEAMAVVYAAYKDAYARPRRDSALLRGGSKVPLSSTENQKFILVQDILAEAWREVYMHRHAMRYFDARDAATTVAMARRVAEDVALVIGSLVAEYVEMAPGMRASAGEQFARHMDMCQRLCLLARHILATAYAIATGVVAGPVAVEPWVKLIARVKAAGVTAVSPVDRVFINTQWLPLLTAVYQTSKGAAAWKQIKQLVVRFETFEPALASYTKTTLTKTISRSVRPSGPQRTDGVQLMHIVGSPGSRVDDVWQKLDAQEMSANGQSTRFPRPVRVIRTSRLLDSGFTRTLADVRELVSTVVRQAANSYIDILILVGPLEYISDASDTNGGGAQQDSQTPLPFPLHTVYDLPFRLFLDTPDDERWTRLEAQQDNPLPEGDARDAKWNLFLDESEKTRTWYWTAGYELIPDENAMMRRVNDIIVHSRSPTPAASSQSVSRQETKEKERGGRK